MDSPSNKPNDSAAPGSEQDNTCEPQDPNRRRFSRSALAGSAVLLSLGNRSAWGQTVGCMSIPTINSFDPATGMFISTPAEMPERNEGLAAEIHRIASAPDFLGSDGTYSTCQDPDEVDGICLVKGDCPP